MDTKANRAALEAYGVTVADLRTGLNLMQQGRDIADGSKAARAIIAHREITDRLVEEFRSERKAWEARAGRPASGYNRPTWRYDDLTTFYGIDAA